MKGHAHREFGSYANVNLSPQFEARGDTASAEFPAPELYNFQRQHLRQEEEQARKDAVRQETSEEIRLASEWERNFSFGAVTKPEQNTLRAYKFKLRENGGANNILFSPENYPVFDNVIFHLCGLDKSGRSLSPAFNPDHPRYEDFAPLRRNIAVLRNYLLVTMFPDGDFKPGENSPAGKEDKANLAKIQQMARKLGTALAPRPWLPVRFLRSLGRFLLGKDMSTPDVSDFMREANIPDKGIETMYNYLLGQQSNPSFHDSLPFVNSPRDWGLAAREQTPFSDENMRAFSRSSMMEEVANEFDRVVTQLKSVDTMSDVDKRISVQHAREILEKLRVLLGNPLAINELSELTDPKQAEAFVLLRATAALEGGIAEIAAVEPDALRSAVLEKTMDALDSINCAVKTEAQIALMEEGQQQAALAMHKRRGMAAPRHQAPKPLRDLIPVLEEGLEEVEKIKSRLPAKAAGPVKAPPPVQRTNAQLNAGVQAAKRNYALHHPVDPHPQMHPPPAANASQASRNAAMQAAARANTTITNVRVAQANNARAITLARLAHQQHDEEMKEREKAAKTRSPTTPAK